MHDVKEAAVAPHPRDPIPLRLVGEYETDSTWDHWEMHPHGDEIVHLVAGTIDPHLDAATPRTVRLERGETIVVAAGAWQRSPSIDRRGSSTSRGPMTR